MPIHNWSKVRHGVFHDFHQAWTISLRNALNKGLLPPGYFAMAEQYTEGLVPDVVTLERFPMPNGAPIISGGGGGIAIAEAPPKARFTCVAEIDTYAEKANRIVIREPAGEVVAVVEIVSPGNKSSRHAFDDLFKKALAFLDHGIHVLMVDLFPPSERDPDGINGAIWKYFTDEPFELSSEQPLTVGAFMAGTVTRAFIEPVGVGDRLPELPIFLNNRQYVPAPLEMTYQATWDDCPEPVRAAVEANND